MGKATAGEVLQILNYQVADVVRKLRVPPRDVQMSMPIDDGPPRIKVSIRDPHGVRMPKNLSFDLEGRKVSVPIEADDDFQDYRTY